MGLLIAAFLIGASGDVHGQVLLADGQPAAKALLVRQSFQQGDGRTWSHRVDCDEQGRFSFPEDSPLASQIYAFSSDLKQSLIEELRALPPDRNLRIQLKPSCELSLRFSVPGEPGKGQVMLSVLPTLNLPWLGHMDRNGQVNIWMPQGQYNVNVQSDKQDYDQKTVNLTAGKLSVTIEGVHNPFRKLRGKPAPELAILDAIGISKNTKISDFRGKYLLLEFWGWWCKPCVEHSLPALIKLLREHPALRDKLRILAVHENGGGGRTLAEVKQHLAAFERNFWGGPLPFPILLEKAASLSNTYGIRAYPTAVLIDPEGKVVDRADPESILEIVGHNQLGTRSSTAVRSSFRAP